MASNILKIDSLFKMCLIGLERSQKMTTERMAFIGCYVKKSLHESVKKQAKAEKRSISNYLTTIIEKELKNDKKTRNT